MGEPVAFDAVQGRRRMQELLDASNRLAIHVDIQALSDDAVSVARALTGADLTSLALWDGERLVMRAGSGVRTQQYLEQRIDPGLGLGGRISEQMVPLRIAAYAQDPDITRDFVDVTATDEGIGGITGVPLIHDGRFLGVLCAANRSPGFLADRAHAALLNFASVLAARLAGVEAARSVTAQTLDEERQRIAADLHDTVGQLLFGIGASAQQLRAGIQNSEPTSALTDDLAFIESNASLAAALLREAIRALEPASSHPPLSNLVETEVSSFMERSRIDTHVVVLGQPLPLDPTRELCLYNTVREGLHNVEKHAHAQSVVVTLCYSGSSCEVVVQDDGVGVEAGFEIATQPSPTTSFGLYFIERRAAAVGGTTTVTRMEDGGTALRVRIPLT